LSVVGGGVADCLKVIEKDGRFLPAKRGRRFLNLRKVKPGNKGVV
jgi:hypothetical protein